MPKELYGELVSGPRLTRLAKVIAFCATGPGLLAIGYALNHGMIATISFAYGGSLTLYGAIALGYAGFRKERWVIHELDAKKVNDILKKRDDKIGELYAKNDDLEERLGREKAISEKLSQHILGERKGGKKKPKEIK